MKIVGIIAEFNPFHNGHKYLIEKAKEITRADLAICIMSGSFTQAGNLAIQSKFDRAKSAIENGFDVVIELPAIYATSSSEYFAFGAVNILHSLGCVDYLCFGSETGNTDSLISIAKKLLDNNDKMWELITQELRSGISFAVAREKAISTFLTEDEVKISNSSNNILAVQYIKTLMQLKSKIIPIAIKREEKGNIVSATKIRELLLEKKDVSKYIPTPIEFSPYDYNYTLHSLIRFQCTSSNNKEIKEINEVSEGLENKIYEVVNYSTDYDDLIKNIKSKRYQLTRIKRILINILLGIKKDTFMRLNSKNNIYAHVLAVNSKTKKDILSILNKNSKAIVITSINDELITNLPSLIQESIKLDILASNYRDLIFNEKLGRDYTNKL